MIDIFELLEMMEKDFLSMTAQGFGNGESSNEDEQFGNSESSNEDEQFLNAKQIDLNNFEKCLSKESKEEWEIELKKLLLTCKIGEGAFGTVYRGVLDGQNVAVKVLEWGDEKTRRPAEIAALRNAFRKEVGVWHKLDHPNVTRFIGASMGSSSSDLKISSNGKSACIVLEYLCGGTLKSYIRNKMEKLDFSIVIQFALDISRGLSYLHSQKIVHRDLKTENILLSKCGSLKIADFGLARFEAENLKDMTGKTGTIGYMAPEVLDGKPYNRKCDVYSFGICLWEIYCCEKAFVNFTFAEIAYAVVKENLRPKIPKYCPRSLTKVIKTCWDANPNKRPEMHEVVQLLEKIDISKGTVPMDQPHGCFFLLMAKWPSM